MTNPANPSAPTPAGDDRNLVAVDENYIALSFEDRLRLFWQKHSKLVTTVLVVVLVVIAGREAWEYLAARKEKEIGAAYAASSTPAQLKSFVAANPQHSLAGVAHLRMADEAYAAGQYADAIPAYQQAATVLKTGPLASRARLGAAMAVLQTGRAAEAQTALKTFAANETEIETYRAEAYYHLTSLAASDNNSADVKTYSDQLMKLDPSSPWTQRALALRSNVDASEPASSGAAPTITLPGGAN
ncbi:MAG TPA: tetratricopeptide repeat protein [Opitutus sp.]|nr:tetratricopeptide repeat protein [Opitutus sp.]